MGLLIDYFTAPSDRDASTALAGGPGGRFPSVCGTGIEPVVILGKLEELLTGKTFCQQLDDPGSRPRIASAEDDQIVVIKLGDGFTQALAGAGLSGPGRLAAPWSQIEEFGGAADPALLAEFLRELQKLAEAPPSLTAPTCIAGSASDRHIPKGGRGEGAQWVSRNHGDAGAAQ